MNARFTHEAMNSNESETAFFEVTADITATTIDRMLRLVAVNGWAILLDKIQYQHRSFEFRTTNTFIELRSMGFKCICITIY